MLGAIWLEGIERSRVVAEAAKTADPEDAEELDYLVELEGTIDRRVDHKADGVRGGMTPSSPTRVRRRSLPLDYTTTTTRRPGDSWLGGLPEWGWCETTAWSSDQKARAQY